MTNDMYGRTVLSEAQDNGLMITHSVFGADAVDDGVWAFSLELPASLPLSMVLSKINCLQPGWYDPGA